MFATLVYNASAAAAGASNTDLTAATDPDFTGRNSHYTFTEPYKLLGVALVGASVTRGRFQVPSWNATGEFTIFNVNRSLQPPSNPQWDLYYPYMPDLPLNEEVQVQASNNLGAATEIENAVLQIVTPDWNQNVPQSSLQPPIIQVRASFTVTPTANAWSGGQTLTFSQALRGGVYTVCGCVVQGSNSVAFRMIFPRAQLYRGRKLRPGNLIQNALGDVRNQQVFPPELFWGQWGQFHTFEPPTIEVFGTAANNTTYQVFMWLVYNGPQSTLYGAAV